MYATAGPALLRTLGVPLPPMKLVFISDTHGDHAKLGSLSGDVLIHCGDFSLGERGADAALRDLDAWFSRQDFKHILCTGGNHDFLAEEITSRGKRVFEHAVCLTDQVFEIDGFKFYGAPWVPELTEWAHFLAPEELARAWSRIPSDVDVLITHTPPRGILDSNSQGKACGCMQLRQRVAQVRPQVHCFGHIHASSCQTMVDNTLFVNASLVDKRYTVTKKPIEFDLQTPRTRT